MFAGEISPLRFAPVEMTMGGSVAEVEMIMGGSVVPVEMTTWAH